MRSTQRVFSTIMVLMLSLMSGFAKAEAITVPMDPWPPWKFVNLETWKVDTKSIDIALIETLLSAYNNIFDTAIKAQYEGYPWKRCLEMMKQGKADFISGVLKRPERETYMIFLEPPYKTKSSKTFYVLKGKENTIQNYEDLYQLKIGVQAGVKYFERFDNDPKIRKEEAGDDISNFRKLEYGRIDAVISTQTQADYLIATQGFKGKFGKAVFSYDYHLPVYFAISKKSLHAGKAPQFSAVIKKLSTEGVFETLINEYFEKLNNQLVESD